MCGPLTARPAICLNMIVRNEAHIINETLDAVAPYVSSWVIVDTGSDDGTQDLIRNYWERLGIPGELYERPWRNFGDNRTEALALAQGHGDYIWVMDADDMVIGTPDFTRLSADIYSMRIGEADGGGIFNYWRHQLFRDGLRVRYEGVVHERAVCDEPCVFMRLEGEYHIESRHVGARNLDSQKYERDRDLLLAEVERNPEDARSVFYLAQSYFLLGDFDNARKWYARRVEMGGWDEEIYYALYRAALSMSKLGSPWPDIQDAYLRAWEFRPTRAEPLYQIGLGYRREPPENFFTRLTAVLEAEAQVFQVAINFGDAVELTGASAAEQAVRRAPDADRYVLTDKAAYGPAMFDTARLDRAGGVQDVDPDPIAALGRRAAAAGLRTATLHDVLCIASV